MKNLFKNQESKILIVEMDQNNIQYLGNILVSNNYKVSFAGNITEAVSLAEKTIYDLIIFNSSLLSNDTQKDMDQLRSKESTKDIPIIFAIPEKDLKKTIEKLKLEPHDYFIDPFESSGILARINLRVKLFKLEKELSQIDARLEEKVKQKTKEIIESNKEIITEKQKAEKADRLKSEYLVQMSHDIRTPLNAIINFTGLMKEEYQQASDEEFQEMFDSIANASSKLIRTIELLINLAEAQSGSYDSSPTQIDLMDICSAISHEFSIRAISKNVQFEIRKETDKTQIIADEYSLWQVLNNLVDNAIKFTSEGKVDVIVGRNKEQKLIIEVSDTGVGMSEDYMDNLFEPFTQESTGYARKVEGNGLGLSLTREYCKINNIDIELETEKGKGSIFRLVFNYS
jgi:signal transduction histidine kinase